MAVSFRKYNPTDYLRVRDFLALTYGRLGETYNWHITRWNFSRYVGQVMHQTTSAWDETVGLWEDELGRIVAVVSSEGEERGEVYFQVAESCLPDSLLGEMLRHAEERLGAEMDGHRFVRPCLPAADERLAALMTARGYVKTDESETTLRIRTAGADMPVDLPPGFSFRDGRETSANEHSIAHARAFGYFGTKYVAPSLAAFARLEQAPDYRPDLNIQVVTDAGEIASFCTMWHDRLNHTGCLEPVGTVPEYRRLGLGRAAIREGLRRIAAEGAASATVGSDQQFYKDIGFTELCRRTVWEKRVPIEQGASSR